ncbi:MAG: response regulator [Pyrinomonadaceae bacterium]|nr:response regulator [Pyrinomonadaceae bacterium]
MKTLSILHLEDSPPDAELVHATMLDGGIDCVMRRVETRADFQAAVAEGCFDLTLADHSLPSFDGISALAISRELCPDVPFIFVSGALGEELAIETLKSGATDYVLKERLERLVPSVRRALREAEERAERKQIEEALRDSEEHFRAVAETAADAVITIDESSVIQFINAAAEKIFGHAVSEMIGQSLTALMPDYLRRTHEGALSRYLETGRRHISWAAVGLPGLHKDGHEVPLEVSFAEFVKGGRRYFTGIARDITERRRAEEERERLLAREQELRQQAEQANRLKDEFLATVSHELRTPLTSILGWAQLLNAGRLDEPSAARAIETIARNARAQMQLIEDLLNVSRIITGKLRLDMRPVELFPIVEAAIDAVRPAADAKAIALQTAIDRMAGVVSGDPDRLQQIIWNLLSNAIKFTPKGGRVETRLERVSSRVRLTVSDTGAGISPKFLPHVFDRFRQADSATTRTHGGLGLGLAIVRHLTELHGGTVSAASAGEGQGSIFTVELPLMPLLPSRIEEYRSSSTPQSAIRNPQSAILRGLRVLIIEDEADARAMLRVALEQSGANVTAVASADEALRALVQVRPDVVISDIGMPDEDGFALIRKLRALPPEAGGQIPALALTAYARDEDRRQALSAGFQMHLSKPVEPDKLIATVARLAGRMETA